MVAKWKTPVAGSEVRAQANVTHFVLIALLGLATNARSLGNRFVYDDLMIVTTNPHFATLGSLLRSLDEPYWYISLNLYRPLTTLSLGLDWLIGGGSPVIFHAENLLLHALATLLVGLIASRWLPPIGAYVAALTFAVHPVHVEVIATAVGRGELLCAVMLLGIALIASDGRPATTRTRLTIAILAAAALASKEVGVIAPVIAFVAARMRTDDWRSIAHVVLPAVVGVLPLLAMRFLVLGSLAGDLPHPALVLGWWTTRVGLALATLPTTLVTLLVPRFAPIDIAPSLPDALGPSPIAMFAGGVIVVIGIVVCMWHVFRPSPGTLGVVIVGAALLPVMNLLFPSGVVLSGRTMYTATIGGGVLVGWLAAHFWARSTWTRHLSLASVALWVVIAATTSVRDLGNWRDEAHLSESMLARHPESFRAHMYAAEIARTHGDMRVASTHYRDAIALFPREKHLLFTAAGVVLTLGDTADALAWLGEAVKIAPDHIHSRTRLVKLSLSFGDTARARALLNDGLLRSPDQRLWHEWRTQLDADSAR
jgi:protein O-mannosyl-transferase